MTAIFIDSTDQKTPDLLNSFIDQSPDEVETWAADLSVATAATFEKQPEDMNDGVVVVGSVEGLPLALVEAYADIAIRHAVLREADPGVWLAVVTGVDGAWGDGESPQVALSELREAIIGWVAVKRRIGATDIPLMEGIDLNPPA